MTARILCFALGIAAMSAAPAQEVKRLLPPTDGLALPEARRAAIETRLAELEKLEWELDNEDAYPDAGVFTKAVRFALEYDEFWSEKQFALPEKMLELAEQRLKALAEDQTPWAEQRGLLVRGYESSIDRSLQPYGLEIPENLDLSKPVPLLVWLHGRGDKTTDLHFIDRCLSKSQALGGKVSDQQNAIIVHPFGRHCVGFKHAGEIDMLEVIEEVKKHYAIDPDQVALAGFSMGGAGAWHLGAHYRDHFCAVHAGAGFAETKEYVKLKPEDFPSPWVQTLWQTYDVPSYTRNLLNGPLLAYSGEEDKQKQAADLMEREIATAGGELRHEIGPGMGHKYHDDSAATIWRWLVDQWESGRRAPETVHLQTPTLRYSRQFWVEATGLEQHWVDSRIEATADGDSLHISTQNVSELRLWSAHGGKDLRGSTITIDGGAPLSVNEAPFPIAAASLVKRDAGWTFGKREGLRKRPHLQGPIDDAFMSRFIIVPPEGPSENAAHEAWIQAEVAHFQSRWKALMRGEAEVKSSDGLTGEDRAASNLILFGTPETNPEIAAVIESLPITWTTETLQIGSQTWSAKDHLPVLIYPNPAHPDRYLVINSGLTFREPDDKTNSQQNPKLPDWAIIDLDSREPIAAEFFDERWQPAP